MSTRARAAHRIAIASLALTLAAALAFAAEARPGPRIVSLNPSLTAILIALGAADALVGVDDFSARQQPEVASLPRVGGLFNPSLEAVAALEPDLVVLVPSVEQRDFRNRLASLGIPLSVFDNVRFEQVLENIARLGAIVGREAAATHRIAEIRRTRAAVARVVAERRRPSAVLVLQREPIFVAGSGSFIDEMLEAAGARNLGRAFADPYPRVAAEWLVSAAPDVILDISPDPGDPLRFWSRWPTLPAVSSGRVLRLEPEVVTLPGPFLDRSLTAIAAALHGADVVAEIAAAVAALAPAAGPGS